jgi:hypothetical protein
LVRKENYSRFKQANSNNEGVGTRQVDEERSWLNEEATACQREEWDDDDGEREWGGGREGREEERRRVKVSGTRMAFKKERKERKNGVLLEGGIDGVWQ